MAPLNQKSLQSLLENPQEIPLEFLEEITAVIDKFPYFQAPRVIQLKLLKEKDSYLYNDALKKTAAYTLDRHILFDYITKASFNKKSIPSNQKLLQEISVNEAETIRFLPQIAMDKVIHMQQSEADEVLNPELFKRKTPISTHTAPIQEKTVHRPLEFRKTEHYAFTQWLQLTKPYSKLRASSSNKTANTPSAESSQTKKTSTNVEKPKTRKKKQGKTKEKAQQKTQQRLIDSFIEKNPRLGRITKSSHQPNLAKEHLATSEVLMTETLAQVYVVQKKYDKALQAYKILILKNPEKSGFFADQIRAIKKLMENP